MTYHGDITETWTLQVVPTDVEVEFTAVDAWAKRIWLYANGRADSALGFRYRKAGAEASETEYKDYWTAYVGYHVIHYFRGMRVTNGGTTSNTACWITQASKY